MGKDHRYFVYLLASQPYGTLYVGVTGNLARRIDEHREDLRDAPLNYNDRWQALPRNSELRS